ncbi:hypothetical protein KC361_g148 [Hortaea werneckii]|nr:hypothetical protein KC361_g148 [Hortaea werneckii]
MGGEVLVSRLSLNVVAAVDLLAGWLAGSLAGGEAAAWESREVGEMGHGKSTTPSSGTRKLLSHRNSSAAIPGDKTEWLGALHSPPPTRPTFHLAFATADTCDNYNDNRNYIASTVLQIIDIEIRNYEKLQLREKVDTVATIVLNRGAAPTPSRLRGRGVQYSPQMKRKAAEMDDDDERDAGVAEEEEPVEEGSDEDAPGEVDEEVVGSEADAAVAEDEDADEEENVGAVKTRATRSRPRRRRAQEEESEAEAEASDGSSDDESSKSGTEEDWEAADDDDDDDAGEGIDIATPNASRCMCVTPITHTKNTIQARNLKNTLPAQCAVTTVNVKRQIPGSKRADFGIPVAHRHCAREAASLVENEGTYSVRPASNKYKHRYPHQPIARCCFDADDAFGIADATDWRCKDCTILCTKDGSRSPSVGQGRHQARCTFGV